MEQEAASAAGAGRARLAFAGGRLLFVSLWLVGLAALATLALGRGPDWPGLGVLIALLLLASIGAGVTWQRSGLLARPIVSIDGVPGRLALTFDDGPDPEVTPRVLTALAAAGMRATFFVLGERVARHPELARRIVLEGHELGNHSLAHAWNLGLRSGPSVAEELRRTSQLIFEASGQRPRFFRPPAAVITPRIEAGARRAGLRLCGHSLRSGDGSPLVSPERIFNRLRGALRPGAILLLHDASVKGQPPASLALLPELFAEMRRRGLVSATLGELIGES